MAQPKTSPITSNTIARMIFDAGALYRDLNEDGEERLGATRGGSSFTVEKEERIIEVDGQKGPTQRLRRVIRHTARLETTLVEFSHQTFQDLTRGTTSTQNGLTVIQPTNDLTDDDYYTNIALLAEMSGSDEDAVLMLKNVIATGEWSVTVDDQDEGVINITLEAHYDPDAMNTPPYEIHWPTDLS